MHERSSMELVDIGANLANSAFEGDREAVVARAVEARVTKIIVTGTSLEISSAAAELAQSSPELYATTGVHPHEASTWNSASANRLRTLAKRPRVVAIGETGLDFYRNYAAREDQERAFAAQLDLAVELELPVFLHEREAHDRQLEILTPYRRALRGAVAHCFTGTAQELDRYLSLDCYIGITGWICDERRGLPLRKLVRRIPADRLLLETDAPYLLPRSMPPRPAGRRNEPSFLTHVLEMVAVCVERPTEEIAAATSANANELFRFSDVVTRSTDDRD